MKNTNKFPGAIEYKKVVEYLDHFILDPKLKGGVARKSKNFVGILLFAGGYSVVFPIEMPGGKKVYALRVWKADIDNAKKRYQEISNYLKQIQLPYFVDFEYVERGITVEGNVYPIIRMEWAEGETLKPFIKKYLDSPEILRELAKQFLQMVEDLHAHQMSHGDLQHENIIVERKHNTIQLKLIDYDSMFVPALSGQPDQIVGLPTYQHPIRIKASSKKKASHYVDYFSELVIYLSLMAYAEQKSLWIDFKSEKANGLLFTEKDFENPDKSKIFNRLNTFSNEIRDLSKTLQQFCNQNKLEDLQPLEQVVSGHAINNSNTFSSLSNIINTIKKPLKSSANKTSPPDLQNVFQQIQSIPKPTIHQNQFNKPVIPTMPKHQKNYTTTTSTHKNINWKQLSNALYLLYIFMFIVVGTAIPKIFHLNELINNTVISACVIKTLFYVFFITGVILSFKKVFRSHTPNIIYTVLIITLVTMIGTYVNVTFYGNLQEMLKEDFSYWLLSIYILKESFYYWILSIGIITACNSYFNFTIGSILYHSFIVFTGALLGELSSNIITQSYVTLLMSINDGAQLTTLDKTIYNGIYEVALYGVFALTIARFSLGLNKIKLMMFSVFISAGVTVGFSIKEFIFESQIPFGLFDGSKHGIFYLSIFLSLYFWYLIFKE